MSVSDELFLFFFFFFNCISVCDFKFISHIVGKCDMSEVCGVIIDRHVPVWESSLFCFDLIDYQLCYSLIKQATVFYEGQIESFFLIYNAMRWRLCGLWLSKIETQNQSLYSELLSETKCLYYEVKCFRQYQ